MINDNCETAQTWANWATAEVANFKAVGANSIGLTFPLYTDSATSNKIYEKLVCGSYYSSPSPARIAAIVQIAHSAGLQVLLRPVLDETKLEKTGLWRGLIKPSNISLWFKNYFKTLQPYLTMSQSYGVEHFAISTELDSLAHKTGWKSLIAQARAIYHGNLSFDFSWNPNNGDVRWPGTTPAMDTYRYVKASPTATAAQLLKLWNKSLTTTDKVHFSISGAIIEEVGILAQKGAYLQPYAWSLTPRSKYPFNQSIQATWFTMACMFMKSHSMGGIYYWGPAFYKHGLSQSADTIDTQDIQPKAQAALKSCFSGTLGR
jgi:hypothetical protein